MTSAMPSITTLTQASNQWHAMCLFGGRATEEEGDLQNRGSRAVVHEGQTVRSFWSWVRWQTRVPRGRRLLFAAWPTSRWWWWWWW
jgi:hypothetical protein